MNGQKTKIDLSQFLEILPVIKSVIIGLLTLAKFIAKLTPSLKDDKIIQDIENALNKIGGI